MKKKKTHSLSRNYDHTNYNERLWPKLWSNERSSDSKMNYLRGKCTENSLITESSSVNICPGSYNISLFLKN